MTVTREGLTWQADETIEQFVARVQKKLCDEIDMRLVSLTGEERLRELLLICQEKFQSKCIPAMGAESIDTTDLHYLVGAIVSHLVPA